MTGHDGLMVMARVLSDCPGARSRSDRIRNFRIVVFP